MPLSLVSVSMIFAGRRTVWVWIGEGTDRLWSGFSRAWKGSEVSLFPSRCRNDDGLVGQECCKFTVEPFVSTARPDCAGGCALCFALFVGVSAWQLKAHPDTTNVVEPGQTRLPHTSHEPLAQSRQAQAEISELQVGVQWAC